MEEKIEGITNNITFIKGYTKKDKDRLFIEIPRRIIKYNDINEDSMFLCKLVWSVNENE